ncbi:MAG: hypothetical protein EZS26_001428 [Candidatus Ordinivivax streblomastigis]|uniref:SPOR domain-containing protein n=1 Tax=Candidatus Ordinivivax streblomastigis TaxID=2540710 RepID=A0A5M8P1K6_9BACT|nr:MAG: hypothetical protein EZS26_001428 [Candidatus Ordinivivax streblomastigis]
MQKIPFYIAYLLTKQECVIIPGFGAFIASESEDYRSVGKDSLLCAPVYSLGFNSDIRHNDGLLANTLAKGESISYKDACLYIRQYVDHLNDQLSIHKTVLIPWIGNLSLAAESKLLFTPALHSSCNANRFGLYDFYLPTLAELEEALRMVHSHKKQNVIYIPIHRRMLRWTAAAAMLALFLLPIPLNESSSVALQQAGFSPKPLLAQTFTSVPEESPMLSVEDEDLIVTEIEVPAILPAEPVKEFAIEPNKHYYYIVLASLPTKSAAEEQVASYRKAGSIETAIISTNTRYRVYINKFEDKTEAENYLNRFRAVHPQYSDAWLLGQ